MRIGEVARRTGLSVAAIRYYERLGLLRRASRAPSGYREFSPDVVRCLEFIRRAQELGFSLLEIQQLLVLRLDPASPAAEVRARVESKLESVGAKMRELKRLEDALQTLKNACCAGGVRADVTGCPILDALDGVTGSTGRERRMNESVGTGSPRP